MPIRPETQGQPFRPSASRERQITQVLQKSRQASAGVRANQFGESDYSYVYARIPASATIDTIKPFEAAFFNGPDPVTPEATDNIHLTQRIASCLRYNETADSYRQWGIALDTITKDDVGRVLVSGVSWLDTTSVSSLDSNATHFDLINGVLVGGYNGRATILQTPTQPHCLVDLGAAINDAAIGLTTSTIAAATYATGEVTPGFGSITVYVWNSTRTKLVSTGRSLTVVNLADSTIASGKLIMAKMMGKTYFVDWELCS
jgi:hypothetical protein